MFSLFQLIAGQESQDGLVCSPQKTFPHPDDCARYYYCDNTNTPQVFFCSPGLHFNPDSELCDLPDSAPCPYVSPSSGQPSAVTLPDDTQPSDPSLPADEGLVVGQSYSSSLPNSKLFYTPSVPALLDLEQPSAPSLPVDETVVPEQSYVSVFPGRGGPIYQQPEGEDRKDDEADIIYETKSDNTSESSFGTFFTALRNFDKTSEEGRQKEEEDVGFVAVKRQAPADDVSAPSSFNFTDEPTVVYVKEEGKTEEVLNEGTPEVMKTVGRCSADSDFFARSSPADAVDPPSSTSEKADESTTSGEPKELKTEVESVDNVRKYTDMIVWPLFPRTNLTVVNEDSDNDSSKTSDYPTVKQIELDTTNQTEEWKSPFNYPTFTISNLNETSPLENSNAGHIETFEEKKEGDENKTPEKVEEIEEAKSTIIFESHSEEEESDKIPEAPEGPEKFVIKETAIL